MQVLRRIFSGSRGQALVETALVLPLLLLLLWGVVEFGRIGHAYLSITHAAREGARAGAVGATDEDIEAIIEERTVSLNDSNLSKEITPSPGNRFSGEPLRVELQYQLPLTFPLIGAAVSNPLSLEYDAVMRLE